MARIQRTPDPIKEIKTYVYPKGIVTVVRPDLTPEEHERRMNEIKKATVALLVYGKKK